MSKKVFNKTTLCSAVMAVTVGSAPSLYAQELEEIIVSAQKREQSLQDTPLSVSAFDSAALAEANITGLTEIAQRTPGLTIATFNLGQPQIYIRGIGSNEDAASGDPSVVVFLDEVYLGRPAGSAFDLYDLERIEVLRGPQGTLYGKNASGGAINITTRKPSQDFNAKVEVGAGNLDQRTLRGYVTGGLSDDLAGSLSLSLNQRDGYVENVITGNDLQDQDSLSGRAALRFTPSDTVEALFSLDYSTDDGNSAGRKVLGGARVIENAVEAAFPGISADPFRSASDIDGLEERDIWGISARVTWDLSIGELVSITAYRESEFDQQTNLTGNSVGQGLYVLNFIDEEADQISQEFRLSNTSDGLISHWVAGVYYIQENAERREDFIANLPSDAVGDPANPAAFIVQDNETTSFAAFGEATLGLTEQLSLTLGARYTNDDKDLTAQGETAATASGVAGVFGLVQEDYQGSDSDSWDEVTYKVLLDYQPTDDWLIYGSFSTGFKSGGYGGNAFNAIAALTPFEPETVDAFEVGVKGTLLNNRMRINLSIFSADYEDFQEQANTNVNGVPATLTTNAAEVSSEGVEVELVWLIIDGLELSGSRSWLDAEYEDYLGRPDLVGNTVRNAPEDSYSVALSYDLPLTDNSGLNFRLDYRYQSTAFQGRDNFDFARIPSYGLLDGRIAYRLSNNLEVSIWGKNLEDEEYLAHNFPLGGGGATISGLPRTYGMSVSWEY